MQKRTLGYTVALGVILVGGLGSAALADRARDTRLPMGGMMVMPFNGVGFDFDAADADKDDKLTPAEIKAYHAGRLKAADTDGDGNISVDELVAVQMKQVEAFLRVGADRRMQDLDGDGDGAVSVAELIGGAGPHIGGKMLQRIDTDGDGAISKAELDAAKTGMGGHGMAGHGKRGHGKGGRGGPDHGGDRGPDHERGPHGKKRGPGPDHGSDHGAADGMDAAPPVEGAN